MKNYLIQQTSPQYFQSDRFCITPDIAQHPNATINSTAMLGAE
ncbi:hypothetical protein ACQ4M4_07965 [Leptolyngbya sp. AN02str]